MKQLQSWDVAVKGVRPGLVQEQRQLVQGCKARGPGQLTTIISQRRDLPGGVRQQDLRALPWNHRKQLLERMG